MSFANTQSSDDRLPTIPEAISRSSSITVVSPSVRDGVEEIVEKLVEIGGIMGDLDPAKMGQGPDIEALRQDISNLQAEVEDTKLTQSNKLNQIRDEVENCTKDEITAALEGKINAIIPESVAEHVKQEMEAWASRWDAPKFVTKLGRALDRNNGSLEKAKVQLENSLSRHANSTVDIIDDFNVPLRPIKLKDGSVSNLFPESLRQLFSYDAPMLGRLLGEYELYTLREPAENLNRFLIFIGINTSIPAQLVESLEEDQPPLYPTGSIPGSLYEPERKSTRRRSSAASDKGLFGGLFG